MGQRTDLKNTKTITQQKYCHWNINE